MKTYPLHSISLEQAKQLQFKVIDAVTRNFQGEEVLSLGDLGVVKGLNKPRCTVKVEEVFADTFDAPAALLVRGSGTGAIRWALTACLKPGDAILVHTSPIYTTTQVTIDAMGLKPIRADFNDLEQLKAVCAQHKDEIRGALVQLTRQKPEDRYDYKAVIAAIKAALPGIPVVTDDNYAALKVDAIGCQAGADLSTFSCFKILGPEGVGAVIGSKELIDRISAPIPLGRIGEVLIVGQSGHVRQTGVEVAGAHGMAYGFVLFGGRLVRLVIGVPVGVRVGFVVGVGVALCVLVCLNIEDVRLPAALGHEIFGQIKVPLFAGDLVQPHQSHLGNLVTGVTTQLARLATEALVYVIGETAGGLEQLVFAGALVVGHRTFNEVAEAVQFVMVTQIGERAIHAVQDVVGVQIAVVELGGTHDVDSLVGGLFQCGVRVMGEGIADCLHPLGEVGVLEHEAVELVWVGIGRVFGERLKSAERVLRRHERVALGILALVLRGSGLEVVHAVAGGRAGDVIVQGVPLIGNHSRAHEFLLGAPE